MPIYYGPVVGQKPRLGGRATSGVAREQYRETVARYGADQLGRAIAELEASGQAKKTKS